VSYIAVFRATETRAKRRWNAVSPTSGRALRRQMLLARRGRLRGRARRLTGLGRGRRLPGALVFVGDDLVLCLFEASSPAVVRTACERAGARLGSAW